MPESSFIFTSNMVYEVSFSNERNGKNPLHDSLRESTDFVKSNWDLFGNLAVFLKKELRKKSAKKSLREWKKGEVLFTLTYKDGIFEFCLNPLAAKKLGMPEVSTFKNLLDFYKESYCALVAR
jgi:hypothetical protein